MSRRWPDDRGRRASAFGIWFSLILLATSASAQLDRVVGQRVEANTGDVAAQQTIDGLSDETDRMASEYRSTIHQVESLRVYNRQLETLVASQREELASLDEQIDGIELVGRQVSPLMLEMVEALEEFVELDVPFLPEERSRRLAKLRELMRRSDVTDAERYRRIVEAYQIENEYGRTIEGYQGELVTGDKTRTVDFLRIGRVALLYQTLDGSETAAWDHERKVWVAADEYASGVRQGLRIARKQTAPDLLELPLPAAKRAP